MCTYAYLELFKLVFSLNKQIFQLFWFIRAILRLLNHTRRLKFQNSQILLKFSNGLKFKYTRSPHSMWLIMHSVSISIFVSTWILQSVECFHTPCRLTLHIDVHSMYVSTFTYYCWKWAIMSWHSMWLILCKHGDFKWSILLSISISVSIWILQSVECPHFPCILKICMDVHFIYSIKAMYTPTTILF